MVNENILGQKESPTIFTVEMSVFWKATKFISVFCMCFALLIGCGEADLDDPEPHSENSLGLDLDDPKAREKILAKAIDEENLQTRQAPSGEELHYAPNQQEPYTGWVKATRNDDIPYKLWQVQHGKRHGIYISWYKNQQNNKKGMYKNGFEDGLWIEWHENGQKSREGAYKDGSEDGLWTKWSENGEKIHERTYKDGKGGWWTKWDQDDQEYKVLILSSGYIESVVFSPDGRTFAAALWGEDFEGLRLWDAATGVRKQGFDSDGGEINSIAFSPDGRTLAAARGDIYLWDVATGVLKQEFGSDGGAINCIAFSPDGRTLAAGGSDQLRTKGWLPIEHGIIYLWDAETGVLKQEIIGNEHNAIRNVAFSPDGRTLAAGEWYSIYLWDVATGVRKQKLGSDGGEINSIAFSPDGRTLAAARNGIYLWDVATGVLKQEFGPDGGVINSIAFSPDGRTLAAARGDIYLWDVATGVLKRVIGPDGDGRAIDSIAFSPDGRTLISDDHANTIRLWDIP